MMNHLFQKMSEVLLPIQQPEKVKARTSCSTHQRVFDYYSLIGIGLSPCLVFYSYDNCVRAIFDSEGIKNEEEK